MSMMPVKQLNIAVIGDEELVSGFRLVGISRYYLIKNDHDTREDVRNALNELIANLDIGLVVILEDYAEHVTDILSSIREGKRITPVIIEAPSKFGTKYKDVVSYYKAFIKQSIGFDVEI